MANETTKRTREVMTAEQTKKLCLFGLKVFHANVSDSDGLIDSFFTFKKVLNDLKTKMTKVIQEKVKLDSQLDAFVKFTENNTLQDALDHFSKWAEKSIASLKELDPEDFMSPKGRDTSNLEVILTGLGGTFEKKSVVPVHCGALLKGSKLGELCTSGIPAEFNNWTELNTVLNGITSQLRNLIPDEVRKDWKRERKVKPEVTSEPEAEENESDAEGTENGAETAE